MINAGLLSVQYLVFSSHKTATQTVVHSLNASGVRSAHCHTLENIELETGQFRSYLRDYRRTNGRKLQVVSIFRDPLDRLVSSFFQSLSEDRYAHLEPDKCADVNGPEDNIIYTISAQNLNELFCRYCVEIDGWGKSLSIIGQELEFSVDSLGFSGRELIGTNELEECRLHLLRFDLLGDLSALLSRISGRNIHIENENISGQRYFAHTYQAFRRGLRLRSELITKIYKSRRNLIELFHPGQYQSILDAKIEQFSGEPPQTRRFATH